MITLTGCDGAPLDIDFDPGDLCGAAPITAEHLIEPGRYLIEVDADNSTLAGRCPVSDGSIRMGPDALFSFTAPHAGRFHFRKRGWATLVSLHAGCDRDLEPLACSPSPHFHDREMATGPRGTAREMAAGEAVLIQVDGFGVGQARLGLTVLGPVTEGGACLQRVCDEDDFCVDPTCVVGTACHEGVCAVPPPPGDRGAACDRFARCADGLYCAADGACAAPPAPELITAWAHVREGALYGRIEIADPARVIPASDLHVDGELTGWRSDGDSLVFGVSLTVDDAPEAIEVIERESGRSWFRTPVTPQPVKAAGERCTPRSEVDRCVEGTVCAGDVPRCTPVEVFVWSNPRWPGQVAVDIRGADLREGEVVDAPGYVAPSVADERRWVGRTAATDGPVEVRYGDHVVARAVPVVDAQQAEDGDRCDMAVAADHCAPDADCWDGACGPSTAPVIDEAIVIRDGRGLALWVRGRDPEGNASRFRFDRRVGAFFVAPPDPDLDPVWAGGRVDVDGEAFEAWFSGEAWFDINSPVVVIDDQGRESAPFEAESVRAELRAPVAEGAACDPLALLFPCTDGLICDGVDGQAEHATCVAVDPVCPEGLADPIVVGAPVQMRGAGPTRQTRSSCFDPWESMAEQYFSFAPAEAGRYTIVAETPRTGGPFGLAVREGCRQRRSERACADEHYRVFPTGAHGVGARIEFDAEAGEALTIVLDGMPEGVITLDRLW